MYLHGEFYNQKGQLCRVEIRTAGTDTPSIEIGDDAAGVWFTDDPVTIESSTNDTRDALLRHTASIRLLSRLPLTDLYQFTGMDGVVNIYLSGRPVFAGYIEPLNYTQEFISSTDEIELNCVDALSALQYYKWRDVGKAGVNFADLKREAADLTFADIIGRTVEKITAALNIRKSGASNVFFDGTVRLSKDAGALSLLQGCAISELLFLGDEEDDTWTLEEVIKELLQYLNLHLLQDGFDFYLFDWTTVRNSSEAVEWVYLSTGQAVGQFRPAEALITLDNVSGEDTRITLDEAFNKVEVKCDIKDLSELIESPLDSDAITSPFDNRQLYMREYIAGNHDSAKDKRAMYNLLHGLPQEEVNEQVKTVDWYVWAKKCKGWTFGSVGTDVLDSRGAGLDFSEYNENQHRIPWMLEQSANGAGLMWCALLGLGSYEKPAYTKDNTPPAKLDIKNYLCIGVNGDGNRLPDAETIRKSIPLATYTGAVSGGVLSPADDNTTHYIVFSGSIKLAPIVAISTTFDNFYKYFDKSLGLDEFVNLKVRPRYPTTYTTANEAHRRWYTQRFFTARTPGSEPQPIDNVRHWYPAVIDQEDTVGYDYNPGGTVDDKINKIPVIRCMLQVGDKCVVEVSDTGSPKDYQWKRYKTREECADDAEYYAQSFTLGFNPAIGDKLINKQHKMQNNVHFDMGIDAEGTAIPIRKADGVRGAVKFQILGIEQSALTTAKKIKWLFISSIAVDENPVMPQVSTIMIEDFKCRIHSDNGLITSGESEDIIYSSDTDERYINPLPEVTFRISSALTAEERKTLGVTTDKIGLGTPFLRADGVPLATVWHTAEQRQDKPEKFFVNAYYKEYHNPRVLLEQELEADKIAPLLLLQHFRHPAMQGKRFYMQDFGRNIMSGTITARLKEITDD